MNKQCTGCKGFIYHGGNCIATCDSCAFRKNKNTFRCKSCIKSTIIRRCNYRWDGVTENK